MYILSEKNCAGYIGNRIRYITHKHKICASKIVFILQEHTPMNY